MMTGSNVAKLVEEPGGDLVWSLGDRIVGRVTRNGALWGVSWSLSTRTERRLTDLFGSSHAACLAAERCWPAEAYCGWVESPQGGFFRQLGRSRIYVRQAVPGWYAVRDRKLLGRAGNAIWFTTASDAMAAVEMDYYTPFDADPFRDVPERYTWLTIAGRRAA
ncbi:hypothetical protein CI1B_48930 [Bradyrhizobium ivorense]|uniref:Uncharacterized protein n=1 Tax=Bradyrhizobium ivorense TaxID=2511166 RepID=A0A508TGF7_9BRAD|nr:hypothetical protein CI1B_48930 [Bradyrhizobium ivorense]